MIELTVEQSTRFFLLESIRHARTLPVSKARLFLKGLLTQMGGDSSEEIKAVREIYDSLIAVEKLMHEQQLELI
jgi:hypothetical protein